MRKPLAFAVAVLSVALAGTAAPAVAATTCSASQLCATSVSFTINTGTLSITTPDAATPVSHSLGPSATTIEIPIGDTSVSDTRVPTAGWSVTATASDFTSGLNTILKSNAQFSVPVEPLWPTCLGTKTRKATASGTNGTVAGLVGCAQTSTSAATYNPTLWVTIAPTVAGGTYSGTVTQSVA